MGRSAEKSFKNLIPIIHVTCCDLSQEHSFAKIEIKVVIQFETWIQLSDEPQSLGTSSYFITIVSVGQTSKVRQILKDTTTKVKGNETKNHELRWITLPSSSFTFHVICSPINE